MPHISVILPVYNAEDTVARAVDSILAQTYRDFELIVVNDGSTDRSAQIVAGFDDHRLRLLDTEHGGVCTATNLATSLAAGNLIARMDADDIAAPEKLQQQLSFLTTHQLDVVGCQVRILNSDGLPTTSMQRYERWINQETITSEQIHALRFVEFPLVNPTILAKRDYFEIGFRDDELPEDYNLMLTAAIKGMRFGKVDSILLNWMDGVTRLTRNDPRYSTEAFMRCRRKHLLAGPLHQVDTVDLWGAGQTGKPWLHWLKSQGICVRRIIEVHPRKIGQKLHGSPVIDAEKMPDADGVPMVIAVGADRTRNLIWPHIADRGYIPSKDAWFVA